jgi:putative peptidoglycan lipid II flippase
VGAGIFLSRIAGYVRQAVFANYFGASPVADVWAAALRTPNVIQNLLGEGALSASFIPVYAELLEQGRDEEAGRFAGAALGLLTTVAFAAAALGMLLAPLLIGLFFPRWEPWQQELGVQLVRILFLMTAVLVVSAWALGVLNSHRRFFVSYVAPVAWNAAMIATLVVFGASLGDDQQSLIVVLAWGALAGGALQLLVQLPWVLPLLRHFRLSLGRRVHGVKDALHSFVPVVTARGVVQVSGWIDTVLAGLLATGALAGLSYAQMLYMLPISVFGMSVAASELPELSRAREASPDQLKQRVRDALGRILFLLLPSTLAYFVIGDTLIAALLERGVFVRADTILVYAILAAYALGLTASSSSRVLSSAYYALRDTRSPAHIAYLRIAVSLVVGVTLMFPLDQIAFTAGGETRRLGAVGLALGASLGAWLEYFLLRRRLARVIGHYSPNATLVRAVTLAGAAAVLAGVGAKLVLGSTFPARSGLVAAWLGASWATPWALAAGTSLAFGVTYLAVASTLGTGAPLRKLLRR